MSDIEYRIISQNSETQRSYEIRINRVSGRFVAKVVKDGSSSEGSRVRLFGNCVKGSSKPLF